MGTVGRGDYRNYYKGHMDKIKGEGVGGENCFLKKYKSLGKCDNVSQSITCLFAFNYQYLQMTMVSVLFCILGLNLEATEERAS